MLNGSFPNGRLNKGANAIDQGDCSNSSPSRSFFLFTYTVNWIYPSKVYPSKVIAIFLPTCPKARQLKSCIPISIVEKIIRSTLVFYQRFARAEQSPPPSMDGSSSATLIIRVPNQRGKDFFPMTMKRTLSREKKRSSPHLTSIKLGGRRTARSTFPPETTDPSSSPPETTDPSLAAPVAQTLARS